MDSGNREEVPSGRHLKAHPAGLAAKLDSKERGGEDGSGLPSPELRFPTFRLRYYLCFFFPLLLRKKMLFGGNGGFNFFVCFKAASLIPSSCSNFSTFAKRQFKR